MFDNFNNNNANDLYLRPLHARSYPGQGFNLQIPQFNWFPELRKAGGALVNRIAREIESQVFEVSSPNPFRIYMFNQCAQNMWNNGSFNEVVELVHHYALGLVASNNCPNLRDGVDRAIPDICRMAAALLSIKAGFVNQCVDQMQRAAQEARDAWSSYVQGIVAQGRDIATRSNSAGGGDGWNNGNGLGLTGGGAGRNGGGHGGGQVQRTGFSGLSGRTEMFVKANASGLRNASDASMGRFAADELLGNAPVEQGPDPYLDRRQASFDDLMENDLNQSQQQQSVATPPVVIVGGDGSQGLEWKSSELQRYPFAFAPSREISHLEIREGEVVQIIQQLADYEGFETMDYEKHCIPKNILGMRDVDVGRVLLQQSPAGTDRVRGAMALIDQYPAGSLDEAQKSVTESNDVLDLVTHRGQFIEVSETALWVFGEVARASASTGGKRPAVFRFRGMVVTPFVQEEDFSDRIRRLRECETFEEAAAALNGMIGKVVPSFTGFVQRKLRDLMQNALVRGMGLDVEIEDFIADAKEIAPHLRKHYGPAFENIWLVNQARALRTFFHELEAESEKNLLESFPNSNTSMHMNGFGQHLSMTLLDCFAHELDIDVMDRKHYSRVLKSSNAALYTLLESVLDEEWPAGMEPYRYLIRTQDGLVLEVMRGWLEANVILIGVVG